jgi:hypothetical protein
LSPPECSWREGEVLLTEAEVARNFRKIFSSGRVTSESIEKAESLIDQLRLESPLRHRLSEELDELRKLTPVDQ